jgi:LPS-assembly protein
MAVCACLPALARAADAPAAKPVLQLAGDMTPQEARDRDAPTRIRADQLEGVNQREVIATGRARLTHGDLSVKSDRLRLDQVLNELTAEGAVRMERGKDVVEGPRAHINLDTSIGEFEAPRYSFQRELLAVRRPQSRPLQALGQASSLSLEGPNQYRLSNATYTTCLAPDPDWYLKVRDLRIDYDRERGEGVNTSLHFKGVPVAWVPWMDFPLADSRQSGLLPPTLGTTSLTGLDLTVPYYFNLAPNYDATIAPRWMGRRGLQLGSEFRYLESGGSGKMSGEWLSHDTVTGTERGLFSTRNTHDFGNGLNAYLDFSQVSDRDYFSDLSTRITSTSQATLNQQLQLNYSGIPWLSSSFNVQRYQTLVGESPYDRLPQVKASVLVPDVSGVSIKMPLEYVKFGHPTKDEGERVVAYPQLSLPLRNSYSFFTPKVGVNLSQYELTRRTTVGSQSVQRSVPTVSLDSGLYFEREIDVDSKDYTQTLEPRLFYVKTPYRDQTKIPVFDSALADFNMSQLFAENSYTGSDRIADANQLTSAVTTRFIDNSTGAENMRVAVGQRFYFSDQRVLMPAVLDSGGNVVVPAETRREGRIADWLGAVSGRVARDTWLDNAYQYDPREHRTERAVLALRYQPGASQVASVSYRYQRALLRDLDISAQWPLSGGWYGVGRYNMNLRDHKLSEAIAGFEYRADCWVLRTVWQTLLNTKNQRNNSVFLQIEFNGLASIGSSPVQLLKRSIGGYTKLSNNSAGDPVFGTSGDE